MIDLVPDEEQAQIGQVAASVATALAGLSASAASDEQWRALGELDLFGLGLPEEDGGAGGGSAAEVLVAESFGRRRAPVTLAAPVLAAPVPAAHVLAAHVLARGARGDLLADVLGGRLRVSLAVESATADGCVVLDHGEARLLTVLRPTRIDVARPPAPAGLRVLESLDEGATLAEAAVELDVVASSADPGLRERADLLLAAHAVGVSGEALARSVDYARQRHQYGKPIGAFQAVKHRCVDMAVRHEAALASVRFAAVRLDAGHDDGAVATAVLMASQAASSNAASAIQVFGGIGFTAEGGLHHLLRRAWLVERLLGPPTRHTERLLAATGSPPSNA